MADRQPEFQYLADIVTSVLEAGASTTLAGFTSMHDLLVVPKPVAEHWTPVTVLAPHVPFLPNGTVRIEHLSSSGRLERVDRPAAEAVPLFWRFMREKFGVETGRAVPT
ncbi:MAG: hypothetical protein QM711_03700 [Micropruina sp.]|uniref:hypothetical protein n=1 Tax=Micropruina sp. TaxID=2737536 RepID=UPI0039E5DF2A